MKMAKGKVLSGKTKFAVPTEISFRNLGVSVLDVVSSEEANPGRSFKGSNSLLGNSVRKGSFVFAAHCFLDSQMGLSVLFVTTGCGGP
ncbi:hypothetical protein, partial [Deinococcus cellulosilyticus]|uniref:hypothetical protein n=1 Tax=Deinococcus cellulosilyticus TaxID=401558 RepID=UPI001C99D4B1